MMILAHGIGGRSDLPAPLWLAAYGGAIAVAVSFFVLLLFWEEQRLSGAAAGRAVPYWVQRVVDARLTRSLLRTAGMVMFGVALAAAWLGTDEPAVNPAPTWLYVWLWVGLVPLSVLFGPVWRLLSPLRTIAAAISRLGVPARELPASVGYWPAAASLLGFVWIELVYRSAATPDTVAIFITGYAAVHVTLGVVYGQRWFGYGDGFEVYSTLLGHLSPIGRRDDGRIVVRSPLDSLATLPQAPGIVAVICLLIGSTGFDGVSRGSLWKGLVAEYGRSTAGYLLLGTAGLLACIGIVLACYLVAIRTSRKYTSVPGPHLATRFVHSLVPIALGYTIAHYFSFAVFQGQAGYLLAADPFGLGWHLVGATRPAIDYSLVSTQTIGLVQVGAIVGGHITGVVAAHDRAVATYPTEQQTNGQLGLLVVMIAFTIAGITLVVGA
jgi:hypothetical protein